MKLRNLTALGAALSLSLAAPMAMAAQGKIAGVEVEADVSAIANPQAAEYWANLSDDLENAIMARVQDRLAEDGATIDVDINEVSLASSFQQAVGSEDSVLEGRVKIDSGNAATFDQYDMQVSLEMAKVYLPEGVTQVASLTDAPENYQALIDAFAENVVERLK